MNRISRWASISAGLVLGVGLCLGEDNVQIQWIGVSTNLDEVVVVGATGTNNSLVISRGAHVAARAAVIGEAATARGNHVLLTDPGSRWKLDAGLAVGRAGSLNSLVVSNGASLLSTGSIGAYDSSHSNVVTITGTGSAWTIPGTLWIGPSAVGCQLLVSKSGQVEVKRCVVGVGASSRANSLTISGAGSVFRCEGDLELADYGSGNNLEVLDGGRLICERLRVASFTGARSNSVLVAGSGSSLDITESLSLGYDDTFLTVADGARLNCGSAVLSGSTFRVRISGAETTWRVSSSLSIRGSGLTNALTVADGGSVAVTNHEGTGLLEITQLGRALGAGVKLEGGTLIADRFMLTNGWIEGHGRLVGPVTNLGSGNLSVPGGKGGLRIAGNLHHLGTIHIDADAESAEGLQVQGHLLHRGRMTFDLAGEGQMLQPLLSVAGSLTLPGDGSILGVTLPAGFRPGWTNAVSLIQWGGRIGQFTNAYAGARLTVGAGSFRVLYTDTELRLSDYFEDRDGDRIDDLWAQTYFGHSPLSVEEKAADADGDGVSNRDEFIAGTDPTDPESQLRIVTVGREAAGVRLRFTANPVKWHRVWRSADLLKWVEVPEPRFTQPAPGVFEWVDEGGAARPAQAYRVSAE
ncbi:MAG: hypothetical protein HS113_07720 [Verrucomicrobiales bacterium]|nr:hypothetical protein [Verrucomicrobiales bacterium]